MKQKQVKMIWGKVSKAGKNCTTWLPGFSKTIVARECERNRHIDRSAEQSVVIFP